MSADAQMLRELSLEDLSAFESTSAEWSIAGDAWSLWDSENLELEPGTGVLAHARRPTGSGFIETSWGHGDLILELEYLVASGSESGIFLQGRYEVQIVDSWGIEQPSYSDAAGISPRFDEERPPGRQVFEGHAPRSNAAKAPGLWQHLRIVFEAPRFDADGRKSLNARVVEVVHNGVTVQEAVDLGGPTKDAIYTDEGPSGPLAFGGAGGIAIRNVRYRHYEPVEPVALSDVHYTLRYGEFTNLSEMLAAAPSASGAASGYVWDLFGQTADRIGVEWEGTIRIPETGEYLFSMRFNWIDEIPYDEDAVAGLGRFTVDDELVIDHTGEDSTSSGHIYLTEGVHPFTLSYFKNRKLWRPIVFFRVEGPGMPPLYLNAPRSLPPPETSYPAVPLDASREPIVLRSFAEYGSETVSNVVSVGDPTSAHYALDLDNGRLLAVWRGGFVDVGSMWTGRGELQHAEPRGQLLEFAKGPTVARLATEDAAWPRVSEIDDLRFLGYRLDGGGRPTFRYAGTGDFEMRDAFQPEQGGRRLLRRLTFSGSIRPDDLWIRVASGMNIQERRPGVFAVDAAYFVDISTDAGARLRTQSGREELLVPIRFSDDEAHYEYSIIW